MNEVLPVICQHFVSDQRVFTEKQEALAYMKKNTGSRLKVFHSSTDVKRFRAHSSKQAGGQDRGTEPKVLNLSANALIKRYNIYIQKL